MNKTNLQFVTNFDGNQTMKSHVEIDFLINIMLEKARIPRDTNGFFNLAKKNNPISIKAAHKIAYHWRAFTRHFIFTVLSGIGVLANKAQSLEPVPYGILNVLQTSVEVITDDLYNASSIFDDGAPIGPNGIHYRWWEESILNPLAKLLDNRNINSDIPLEKYTLNLLTNMSELSTHPLGAAIQLRIVEAIALDISLAFRPIFGNLLLDGKKVFPNRSDLSWIHTHIKAEVVHHQQVTDSDNGVVQIAQTYDEQQELLNLTQQYIYSWMDYLSELESFIIEDAIALLPNNALRKWQCVLCDFIYDEELGIPEEGIEPGTKWEDVSDEWTCPDCGVGKKDFKMVLL